MYRLKELYLESNRLERLPPELGKLTRLRVLNIGNVRSLLTPP
jgi:Leucine-rich repeat (LRR) protein